MSGRVLALALALIGSGSAVSTAGASASVARAEYPAAAPIAVATVNDLVETPSSLAVSASVDYPSAGWAPAATSNYSVFDRPDEFQVNMIVIHDIEGSYSSAIKTFQDPSRHGSAHYVISRTGRIAQMVAEKNVAWHAGNWDFNTRAIGIEHEGYAGTPGSYTLTEYRASAHLAASICSRWGVPMDRAHVIGHYQVPDPNNPGLFGGDDNHWDPGPYWNWSYYMTKAKAYARLLPSPPHMGPDPTAASQEGAITLSWKPAQSCTAPITGYSVVGQPGNVSLNLPANIISVWIPGLIDGVAYSFTVTATNAHGQSSLTSNTAIPGRGCTAAAITGSPSSPRTTGSSIQFAATSTACNSPEYAFWVKARGGHWSLARDYGGAGWAWSTAGFAPGTYQLQVWARQKGSGKDYDAYGFTAYTLSAAGCLTAALTPSLAPPQVPGTKVTFTASSPGCSSPQYRFWILPPGGSWTVVQEYSADSTWLLDSSKYASGNFQVSVWVRQAGSLNRKDSFFGITYWINGGAGCVVSALNPSVASPQAVGATVTFSPQQSGCTNQYKFWLLPPGGSWRAMQAYGVGSTWVWDTAGYGAGIYQVGVWEGSSATPTVAESSAVTSFILSPSKCGSASLSVSTAPPQTVGGTIAFTASSTGCVSPQYQFWLVTPSGIQTLEHAYGGATWSWNTAALAPGTYTVSAWVRQAGTTSKYDAYAFRAYQLTVPVCNSASITASPASPQAAGAQITFSAASAGCSSPRYEFWERPPGGTWKLVRPYGTGSTFSWDSTGAVAGDYSFAVRAVATGSINTYDSYALRIVSVS